MKNVFLGLGLNLGDRRANLEKALNLIISKTKGWFRHKEFENNRCDF